MQDTPMVVLLRQTITPGKEVEFAAEAVVRSNRLINENARLRAALADIRRWTAQWEARTASPSTALERIDEIAAAALEADHA